MIDSMIAFLSGERTEEERPAREARAKTSHEAGQFWATRHATGDQLKSFELCALADSPLDLHLVVNEHIREALSRLRLGVGEVDFLEFRGGALSVWREIQAGTRCPGSPHLLPGFRPSEAARAWS